MSRNNQAVNKVLAQGIRDMRERIETNPDSIDRTHEMRLRKENIRTEEGKYAIQLMKDLAERDEHFKAKTQVRKMTPELDGKEFAVGLKMSYTINKETDIDSVLSFLDNYTYITK